MKVVLCIYFLGMVVTVTAYETYAHLKSVKVKMWQYFFIPAMWPVVAGIMIGQLLFHAMKDVSHDQNSENN